MTHRRTTSVSSRIETIVMIPLGTEIGCHGFTVFGKAVLFERVIEPRRHRLGEDSRGALPQTKVAIITPRDEHCSSTYQIPIRMFSNRKFKRNNCPDASATLESFPTDAHHAER